MSRRHTSADLAAMLIKQGKTVDFKVTKNRKSKDPNAQDESKDQQNIVHWWSVMHSQYKLPERLLMAFPLQGARSARNGARMKAEGMRKGTLDMLLAVARKGYIGLWVENKVLDGVVAPEQGAMMKDLEAQGYLCRVCRSPADAIAVITRYLSP